MASEDPFQRLRSLFERARPLSREDRAALLDRECGDDPALRAQVEGLLESHDNVDAFLQSAPTRSETSPIAHPSTPLREIGPYLLLEKLGEGGFGIVYLAEQRRPVHRKVALKLLRSDSASGQVLARFEAERQALALMDHANIAVVHDAGVTESGAPYFVMEYVAGLSITAYADRADLGLADRLRLFLQVCEAIQHAHTKGVIHRDLKPSNILVTRSGDKAVVKVIDFGIAKAVGARLTDETLHTQLGVMIGTPEYMSPEQASASPLGVDTRSDVYSLGVILYELLVGAPPFDRKEVGESGVLGLLQLIREKEPRKLTTRLRAMGDAASQAAARRRTDVQSLARHLRGDLEWITGKALEKNPTLRYASATALAEDVERYLENRPILARPPSGMYRVRKLVARHRLTTALVGLLALSVLAFAVTASVMYEKQRVERLKAERINGFLVDMLSSVDPSQAKGKDVLVRDVLDQASVKVNTELASEPEVAASLETTMSEVYMALGLYDKALTQAAACVNSNERRFGRHHIETARALAALGDLQFTAGQPDSAVVTLRQALAIAESTRKRDPELLSFSYNSLANLLGRKGQCQEADSLFGRALHAAGGLKGTDSTAYGAILNDRALMLRDCGRSGEAERVAEQVLGLWERKLGPENPRTITAMGNLAALRRIAGEYAEADTMLKRVLKVQEKVLGPDHPNLATNLVSEGQVLSALHKYAEAESVYARSRRIYTATYGETSPQVAILLQSLGANFERQERLDEAEGVLRKALATWTAIGPNGRSTALNATSILARVLASKGHLPEADSLASLVVQAKQSTLGPAHPDVRRARQTLAEIRLKEGKVAESDSLLRVCLEGLGKEARPSEDDRALLQSLLGECRFREGHAEAAESLLVPSTPRILAVPTISASRKRAAVATTVAVLERLGKHTDALRFRAIGDSLAPR